MLPEVVHDRVASVRESLKYGEEVTTQEASALPLRRHASVGGVSGLQKDGNDAPARVFGLRGLDVALNLVRVLVTAHLVLDQKQDSLLVLVVDARKNIDPVHLGPDFDGSHLWSLHPVVLAEEGLDEVRTEPMEVRVRIPTGRVGPSEETGEGGVLGQLLGGEAVEVRSRSHRRTPPRGCASVRPVRAPAARMAHRKGYAVSCDEP